MTFPERTTDATGYPITRFDHVKVVNQVHRHRGKTGTVIRIEHPRVWVALPGDVVIRVSHLSLAWVAQTR